jgi:acetylornithine deacetylase
MNVAGSELKVRLEQWIQAHRQEALELTRSLVSTPSMNRVPDGDELRVQRFVADYLSGLGCEVDVFQPDEVPQLLTHDGYLPGRNYRDRPVVVGRKQGTGGGKSLLFSGHMDTVPLTDDRWTVDPFSGTEVGGKQYGLGIFDMKAGMAAAMFALRALGELGVALPGDVSVETVVDEEFGGANGTLASRLRGHRADAAIVPEPSNLIICPATQGGIMMRIVFTGATGRDFSGEALFNPVFAAARFVDIFRRFDSMYCRKTSADPWYRNGPPLTCYLQGIRGGDMSLPLFDRTPGVCTIDVWIQCFPGTNEEELRREFTDFCLAQAAEDDLLRDHSPRFEKLIRFLPGASLVPGHALTSAAERVMGAVDPERLAVRGAPFACDAFIFEQYSDIPVIVWGPTGGNAHAPDEFIEIDDYLQLIGLYALMMVEWCGKVYSTDRLPGRTSLRE